VGGDVPNNRGTRPLRGQEQLDSERLYKENLVQFAIMGAAFARVVLEIEKPRVALLNVGVEDLKGNETVKAAGRILKDTPLPMEFTGFIEGDGIITGDTDVVVTDGFTGNVALKATEGTARLVTVLLREAFGKSWATRLGYLLSKSGLDDLRQHLDINNHNGGMFIGLGGLVVKSHGGATAQGFAVAIRVAEELAENDLNRLIMDDLKNFGQNMSENEESQEETNESTVEAVAIGGE